MARLQSYKRPWPALCLHIGINSPIKTFIYERYWNQNPRVHRLHRGCAADRRPWVLNFDRGGIETWLPVILGATTILYSLLTDYELGMAKVISMRTHLALDFISGALLAVSPWLFGFADYVWAPHLIVGLIEIGVTLLTTRVPGTEKKTCWWPGNCTLTPIHNSLQCKKPLCKRLFAYFYSSCQTGSLLINGATFTPASS